MKNRWIACLALLCLLPAVLLSRAGAAETATEPEPTNVPREPGYCGESITWSCSGTALIITGFGEMDDFPEGAPWAEYKDEITKIIISNDITYIGSFAFRDFDALTEVEFGDDLVEIGREAFCSCDRLASVVLPKTFRVFGESSFMSCRNLKEFHCAGSFPSFRQNCLWDTYGVIYFPSESPWSLDLIIQLEAAFHGRMEFLASDGTDPYDPGAVPGETELPAETEESTGETGEETEPPTEPPAEEITEAATEPASVPEVTAEPETLPETTGPQQAAEPAQEAPERKTWIGMTILVATAAFLVLGRLLFGKRRKRGKYSRK